MNILTYLLEKYPEKPWKWNGISENPNITIYIYTKDNICNNSLEICNNISFKVSKFQSLKIQKVKKYKDVSLLILLILLILF